MKFHSTRNEHEYITLTEALLKGLAPDGGLYVPENLPRLKIKNFKSWPKLAEEMLKPFFKNGDLEKKLPNICREAFNFKIPLYKLAKNLSVLELFHGPTAAFKDVGAQFLAACIENIKSTKNELPRMVLVATSGDTGGAVGSAFSGRKNVNVVILYPQGKISRTQEAQLHCWKKNVTAIAIKSDFDACQSLVKQAFLNNQWQSRWHLLSANSISLGRLLPQMVYYAGASLQEYERRKKKIHFIIPTGNLGNAVACFWAREMGFPIAKIGLALNANKALFDYYKSGEWVPRPSQMTLANAMDVGAASNFERLRALVPDIKDIQDSSAAISASDVDIRNTIREIYNKFDYLICPHTATGFYAHKMLQWAPAVVVSTAHPAKFTEVIEPLLKLKLKPPQTLKKWIQNKKIEPTALPPDLDRILNFISDKA